MPSDLENLGTLMDISNYQTNEAITEVLIIISIDEVKDDKTKKGKKHCPFVIKSFHDITVYLVKKSIYKRENTFSIVFINIILSFK